MLKFVFFLESAKVEERFITWNVYTSSLQKQNMKKKNMVDTYIVTLQILKLTLKCCNNAFNLSKVTIAS